MALALIRGHAAYVPLGHSAGDELGLGGETVIARANHRITYPSRPLVEPAKVAGASIEELLDNLAQMGALGPYSTSKRAS
mgnify:CR=1 FL=1